MLSCSAEVYSCYIHRSREEILVWKEKQAQVKFAQMKQETERETITTADSKSVEFCKNKKLIRGISKREIWTKMAGLLIKQVQYIAIGATIYYI